MIWYPFIGCSESTARTAARMSPRRARGPRGPPKAGGAHGAWPPKKAQGAKPGKPPPRPRRPVMAASHMAAAPRQRSPCIQGAPMGKVVACIASSDPLASFQRYIATSRVTRDPTPARGARNPRGGGRWLHRKIDGLLPSQPRRSPTRMPSISRDEAAHLARLARLELAPDELDHLAGQLDVIAGYVARVSEVAADDIPPTSHALPMTNKCSTAEERPWLSCEGGQTAP